MTCNLDTNSSDASQTRLLVVDSDINISTLLASNLSSEGYAVETADSADSALRMPLETFSLIITDVSLPAGEISGFEMLERLKEDPSTMHVPVIVCSALDTEADIIDGLNAGADDYVVKPFSLREFMARIRSVLRRHRNFRPARVGNTEEFRTLQLNTDSRTLLIDGVNVGISPTEYTILLLLLKRRNTLLSRDEIFKAAWPDADSENPRLVDVNISRLRKKLDSYGRNIVNRTGQGYAFMDQA